MIRNQDQLMTALVERIVALRPTFERRQQEFALGLYRLLADAGDPIRPQHLAAVLNWRVRDVVEMLERWPSTIQ